MICSLRQLTLALFYIFSYRSRLSNLVINNILPIGSTLNQALLAIIPELLKNNICILQLNSWRPLIIASILLKIVVI